MCRYIRTKKEELMVKEEETNESNCLYHLPLEVNLRCARKFKDLINGDVLDELESMRESIRFAGCSVCLSMFQKGILQGINQSILNDTKRSYPDQSSIVK